MDDDLWAGSNSKFISNALDCINLQLVRHKRELIECQHGYDDLSFHPEYAHQIFGQKELIFGYRDLIVNIHFLASSMKCYLNVKYREMAKASDELKPTNIEETLKEYLPKNFTTDSEQFIEWLRTEKSILWGETVHSYVKDETKTKFFIQRCDVSNTEFQNFYRGLETFVYFFIDASNSIDLCDNRWEIFITFEEYTTSDKQRRYAPIAFCTLFKFYAYFDKIRPRVSQLLVLPPFQRRGHGYNMLNAVYTYFNNEKVKDITAEIPNADFIMVRDLLLARKCSTLAAFAPRKLVCGFTSEMYTEGNTHTKASVDSIRRVYYILRFANIESKRVANDSLTKLKSDLKNMLIKKYTHEKTNLMAEERVMQEEMLGRCVEDMYLTFEMAAHAFLKRPKK